MGEGANSLKGEFLNVVAILKPGLTEFSHPLDQSCQAWCHRRLAPFVFDERGKHKLVHPLQLNMHIHRKPLLLRVLLGALEGGINILLTTMMTKCQPDPRINDLGVSVQRVEIPEQAGI
jgi:hypothetical protein